MRKVLTVLSVVSLSLLVVLGGALGCGKGEEEKEVLSPEISLTEVAKEATLNPADPIDLAGKGIVVEMAYEVSNPNEFEISVNSMVIEVTIEGNLIERTTITDAFYVPGETTVAVRKMVVYQPMAVIGWLMVFGGKTFPEAMGPALDLWTKVDGGTAQWEAACSVTVVSEFGDKFSTYELSWVKPT